jgi:TrmH family RNA methyltransferase
MITLRKLASLKDDTRRRKYPLLFQGIEHDLKNGKHLNEVYFAGLLDQIVKDSFYGSSLHIRVKSLLELFQNLDETQLIRECNTIRYQLLSSIGAEPGDWDFEENGMINRTERVTGELYLFLDGIRSPFNMGSIFRTAESFGIKKIFISEDSSSPEHHRAKRSSMGCIGIVPWAYSTLDDLEGPFFSLELGGKSLDSFPFPKKGTLIIGSEELGVSPKGLELSDRSLGRLTINTGGIKGSINVSVAAGIALQKWYSFIF